MNRRLEKHHTNTIKQDEAEPEARSYCPPELTDQIALQLAATLGFTELPLALNIAYDVRQSAWGAYRKAPEPRASSLPKELRKLLKAARTRAVDPSGVQTYLWPYLGVEDEAGIDELCASRTDLTEAIEQAIQTAQSDPETLLSQLGGRHRDPRIDAFVVFLAQIYRRETGKRPTTTTDPQSGALNSPFDLFVLEAFRHFYPEGPVPQGSVQTTIQQVVEFERETEPWDPTPEDLLP